MALHRSAPPRHVAAPIVLAAMLAGCVGTSDAIEVPEATLAPLTSDATDGDEDSAADTTASPPVTEDSDPTSSSSAPAPTDPATTVPPVTEPTVTEPPVTEPPPPVTTEPAPDPFLRIGDQGAEVGIMQLKLQTLEYLAPGYTEGVFDRATADALIDFQAQYGLVVDGIFGPETDRSLSAAAASVNPDG